MRNLDGFVIVMAIVTFAAFAILLSEAKQVASLESRCNQRGGILVKTTDDEYTCLRRDAIVEVTNE